MEATIFEKLEMWWTVIPEKGAATLCIIVPACWIGLLLLYQWRSAVIELWKLREARKINNNESK
jgi:hypothetical protein